MKLFTVKDSFPWGLLALAALAIPGTLFTVTPSILESWLFLGVTFVMLLIVVLHYWDRWLRVWEWNASPKTRTPMFALQKENGQPYKGASTLYQDLVDLPPYVFGMIMGHDRFKTVEVPSAFKRVADRIEDGGYIRFAEGPFMVDGNLAGGYTQGNRVYVVDRPNNVNLTTIYARHEIGHAILFALGVPANEHEKILGELSL